MIPQLCQTGGKQRRVNRVFNHADTFAPQRGGLCVRELLRHVFVPTLKS